MTEPNEQYRQRFLAQLLLSGLASHWERRAEVLEWARPKPGDYLGKAGDIAERDARLAADAQAYRDHAALLRENGPPDYVLAEIADVLSHPPGGSESLENPAA